MTNESKENPIVGDPSLKESWAIVVRTVQKTISPIPIKFDFVIQPPTISLNFNLNIYPKNPKYVFTLEKMLYAQ